MVRRAVFVALAAVVVSVAGCVVPPASGFLRYFNPVTGSVDVITGIPVCGGLGGPGAEGLADGGGWFYVTDVCDGRVYRYRSGATPMVLASSAVDNVTGGIAVLAGRLFGVVSATGSGVRPGLYEFDPSTLSRVRLVLPQPDGCVFRTVAAAAAAAALYVTGDCGLVRVTAPQDAVPSVVPLATGDLGAVTVAPGGDVWAVDLARNQLVQYRLAADGSAARAVAAVPLVNGPAGVTPACSGAPPALAGDLFVNNVDGVLELVDLRRHGAVSVLASGGLHGGDLSCGSDGELYVTQAGRVQRLLFSGSGSGDGAGERRAAGRPDPGGDPADHAVYPLVLAGGLLAVTIVGLLGGQAALRRRRSGARP